MDQTKKLIIAVMNTLDSLEIQGVENMRKMVMCYDTLEHVAETMEPASAAVEENQKEDTQDG